MIGSLRGCIWKIRYTALNLQAEDDDLHRLTDNYNE